MTLNPTQMKIASTGIIVAVVIASMACVIVYDESRDSGGGSESVYNILARVNSDGSGIYINEKLCGDTPLGDIPMRNGNPFYKIDTSGAYCVDADCGDAWGGLICGTPGNTSIQHVQMKQLVESMGLKFVLYESGTALSPDTVYYISTVTNYTAAMESKSNNGVSLDIGIVWEPQFSRIIDESGTETFRTLGLTNDFFPDHTCCILAGYSPYVSSHTDVALRFLAGYIEAVRWVQEANDPSSANYGKLVDICVASAGLSETVIEDALAGITYLYGDTDPDGTCDLHKLKRDIADVAAANSDSMRYGMKDLGFDNTIQFANRFVDDSYLISALDVDKSKISGRSASVTVSAITGDIHQIALVIGSAKGIVSADHSIFDEYGISVNISYANNGAGVAVALQNGAAQFGFLGAPPATITAVNSRLVTV